MWKFPAWLLPAHYNLDLNSLSRYLILSLSPSFIIHILKATLYFLELLNFVSMGINVEKSALDNQNSKEEIFFCWKLYALCIFCNQCHKFRFSFIIIFAMRAYRSYIKPKEFCEKKHTFTFIVLLYSNCFSVFITIPSLRKKDFIFQFISRPAWIFSSLWERNS